MLHHLKDAVHRARGVSHASRDAVCQIIFGSSPYWVISASAADETDSLCTIVLRRCLLQIRNSLIDPVNN